MRRALVFPLHEADRHPAYRVPNDRVLDWAARSDGRLVPLARLDLDRGADRRGPPRHRPRRARHQAAPPRAGLHGRRRAARAGLRAGGGGAPAGAHPRRPRHAADRRATSRRVARAPPGRDPDPRPRRDRRPGARSPTSPPATPTSSSTRRRGASSTSLALLARVAPEQVLFATDVPYGNHLSALTLIARGAGADRRQRGHPRAAIMGETLRGHPARRAADALGAARAARSSSCRRSTCACGLPVLARSRCSGCASATSSGMLGLAAGVCRGRPGSSSRCTS